MARHRAVRDAEVAETNPSKAAYIPRIYNESDLFPDGDGLDMHPTEIGIHAIMRE